MQRIILQMIIDLISGSSYTTLNGHVSLQPSMIWLQMPKIKNQNEDMNGQCKVKYKWHAVGAVCFEIKNIPKENIYVHRHIKLASEAN